MSAQARVSLFALPYKNSYVPFQDDKPADERMIYPVLWVSLFLAFLVFLVIWGILYFLDMKFAGFIIGIIFFFISAFIFLYYL